MRKLVRYIGMIAWIIAGSTLVAHTQDQNIVIEMTNTATYKPAEIVVNKGEKITWKNTSEKIQTITVKRGQKDDKQIAFLPDEAEPFSSGAIKPGESFSYTFFIPGSYELVSLPNAEKGMQGKIIVSD